MQESELKTAVLLFGVLLLSVLILMARPGYLANPIMLGSLIVGQIIIGAVCKYRKYFFLLLTIAFLWAGMHVPLSAAWLQGRWIVLGIGALAGLVICLRSRDYHFSAIHFVAFFCVLSAVVSASVSAYPQEALLKSLSLFLLLLYSATGARLAIGVGNQRTFFERLVLACEVINFVSFIIYFVFHYALFGNPNSLGAVMGVVVTPVLFWGLLQAERPTTRARFGIELCLATALLASSFSRAGMAAAVVSCFLISIALRRYGLIVSAIAAALVIAVLTAKFAPLDQEDLGDAPDESVASLFLYKGKPGEGILASRKGPWEQTLSAIKENPWFGTGFGTSMSDHSAAYFELTRSRFIDSRMIREHGNSYLAILEWSGLLGVAPFYLLVIVVAVKAGRALGWIRRTGNAFSPVVPGAAIIIAGLIGSGFEDWLFAVGYYLCVFFWAIAFTAVDVLELTDAGPSFVEDSFVTAPQFAASVAGD